MNYEKQEQHTDTVTSKKRIASAVGVMISEYTICAVLPCYEPSVANAWPQPLQHNETEKCCTRDEIAKQHNILGAKQASC